MIDDSPARIRGSRRHLGGPPVAATEEILGQFLGDETFPVTWESEVEKDFFWVYDDLHMPAPGQPDVLRHRRLVAQLRPHVPPLRDPVRGRLAGQERQRLRLHDGHPGRSRTCASTRPSTAPATAPACRATRPSPRRWAPISTPSCRSTAATSPTGGATACGRRWSATSPSSRRGSTPPTGWTWPMSACLLEDAIDVHDRHWKIHWMLNFAQLSATLNLRAVMEKTAAGSTSSCSGGSRTPPRTATGTRSRRSGG